MTSTTSLMVSVTLDDLQCTATGNIQLKQKRSNQRWAKRVVKQWNFNSTHLKNIHNMRFLDHFHKVLGDEHAKKYLAKAPPKIEGHPPAPPPSGIARQWQGFFFRGIFTSRLPLVLIHSHLRYPRRVGWISQHAKRPFWKTFQVESYRYWDNIFWTLLATYGKKNTKKYDAQTNHATCSVYGCFQK